MDTDIHSINVISLEHIPKIHIGLPNFVLIGPPFKLCFIDLGRRHNPDLGDVGPHFHMTM